MKCFTQTYSKFTQIFFFPLMKIIYFLPHNTKTVWIFLSSLFLPILTIPAEQPRAARNLTSAMELSLPKQKKQQDCTKSDLKGILLWGHVNAQGLTTAIVCVSCCILEFSCAREEQHRQDHWHPLWVLGLIPVSVRPSGCELEAGPQETPTSPPHIPQGTLSQLRWEI